MNPSNSTVERAFFDAIANGRVEEARDLVQQSPTLLQAYDYSCFGATPITRVCFQNDRAMLEALIELGADVDRRSDWEMGPWSPLHSAVFCRNADLAEFLLANGATMDVHTAAGLGRVDELTQLLTQSPDRVTELGGDGCHPLHFADTIEVAQLLLDHNAEIEARCLDHYSTPVQYLADKRPEVARFLFSKGAKPDVFAVILADDLELLNKLLSDEPEVLGARMNQEHYPSGNGHDVQNIMTFSIGHDTSPLHAAAKANRSETARMIVEAGQPVDIRGGYDDATPLHLAAWNDCPQVARELLKQGADINARSGSIHNNSPAGWAIVAGSADAFVMLMDHGAEVLDSFVKDAEAAIAGDFRKYKRVPQENYERVHARLIRD